MEVHKSTEKVLQWHPAFYAGIQIELQQEADNLIFENEHQLGTKPFGIDVLIVKKESEKPVQKNIGRIFRKYNIVEYKSPADYLSVDDFYKVYGYTCFYKADVELAESIQIEELTISFVCKTFPRKLFQHLERERQYNVERKSNGIYYVTGDKIPIQIIVTKELPRTENLWLRNLTDQLNDSEDAEALIRSYEENENNNLYKSVMNIIVEANKEKFREATDMCDALNEIIREVAEERAEKLAAERVEKMAAERVEKIAEERAEKLAEERAEKLAEERAEKLAEERAKKIAEARLSAKQNEGEDRVNLLNRNLAKAGRAEDIIKAAENKEYQNQLFKEFGL